MENAALLGIVALTLTTWTAQAQHTTDDVLRDLRKGNARFVAGETADLRKDAGTRRTLAHDHRPRAVVVTCADSRVVPEHLFQTGLGELYTVRVAGNVCDGPTLASIEHAALDLGIELCIVLGHESCAAVSSAVDGRASSPAVARLIERIAPAVEKVRDRALAGGGLLRAAEEENVHHTVAEVLRRSPPLRRLWEREAFRILPARYSLSTGEVEWLHPRPFVPPADERPKAHPPAEAGLPPHVALRMLVTGHRRFLSAAPPTGDRSPARRESLALGQRPAAIVVTDSDARVVPEHLFDAGLGEIFTVRVAGPVLDDEVLASIEIAATATGASLCVVLGHDGSPLLRELALGQDADYRTEGLARLARTLAPAVERARREGRPVREIVARAAADHVRAFVREARQRSAILADLEAEGTFAMLGARYDLETGNIEWLDGPQEPPAAPGPEARPSGDTDDPGGIELGLGGGDETPPAAPPSGGAPSGGEPSGHDPSAETPDHGSEHPGHHDRTTPRTGPDTPPPSNPLAREPLAVFGGGLLAGVFGFLLLAWLRRLSGGTTPAAG